MSKPNYGRDNLMALAAFRYCLGRMTYIVSDFCDWLPQVWGELDDNTRNLIRKETEQVLADGTAGAPCDVEQWTRLAERLWQAELESER